MPWTIRHYHYAYHATYGSPQLGLTTLPSPKAEVRDHGRQLWVPVGTVISGGEVYEFSLPALAAANGTAAHQPPRLLHGQRRAVSPPDTWGRHSWRPV